MMMCVQMLLLSWSQSFSLLISLLHAPPSSNMRTGVGVLGGELGSMGPLAELCSGAVG